MIAGAHTVKLKRRRPAVRPAVPLAQTQRLCGAPTGPWETFALPSFPHPPAVIPAPPHCHSREGGNPGWGWRGGALTSPRPHHATPVATPQPSPNKAVAPPPRHSREGGNPGWGWRVGYPHHPVLSAPPPWRPRNPSPTRPSRQRLSFPRRRESRVGLEGWGIHLTPSSPCHPRGDPATLPQQGRRASDLDLHGELRKGRNSRDASRRYGGSGPAGVSVNRERG